MKVAVYGTLKRGFGNHRLLEKAEFIGVGDTLPFFDMISFGGYPGVISGTESIKVEVFEVSDQDTIDNLDFLEGHPSFFRRDDTHIKLRDEDETEVIAQMYKVAHHNDLYNKERYRNFDDSQSLEWNR